MLKEAVKKNFIDISGNCILSWLYVTLVLLCAVCLQTNKHTKYTSAKLFKYIFNNNQINYLWTIRENTNYTESSK